MRACVMECGVRDGGERDRGWKAGREVRECDKGERWKCESAESAWGGRRVVCSGCEWSGVEEGGSEREGGERGRKSREGGAVCREEQRSGDVSSDVSRRGADASRV